MEEKRRRRRSDAGKMIYYDHFTKENVYGTAYQNFWHPLSAGAEENSPHCG